MYASYSETLLHCKFNKRAITSLFFCASFESECTYSFHLEQTLIVLGIGEQTAKSNVPDGKSASTALLLPAFLQILQNAASTMNKIGLLKPSPYLISLDSIRVAHSSSFRTTHSNRM